MPELGDHWAACRIVVISSPLSTCWSSKMLGLHRDRIGSAIPSALGIGAWAAGPVFDMSASIAAGVVATGDGDRAWGE